jgi:uncharacterized protein YndB with AHSA1/START domain
MAGSTYVYVTFIRTAPEHLFEALTQPEFTRQYWFGIYQESDWVPGAAWRMVFPDGTTADSGEILEVDPPWRLVMKWRNEFRPELKAEGYARCAIDIEAVGEASKLTITHSIDVENSKYIEAVSNGWPRILSNLKSLIETGSTVLPNTLHTPAD